MMKRGAAEVRELLRIARRAPDRDDAKLDPERAHARDQRPDARQILRRVAKIADQDDLPVAGACLPQRLHRPRQTARQPRAAREDPDPGVVARRGVRERRPVELRADGELVVLLVDVARSSAASRGAPSPGSPAAGRRTRSARRGPGRPAGTGRWRARAATSRSCSRTRACSTRRRSRPSARRRREAPREPRRPVASQDERDGGRESRSAARRPARLASGAPTGASAGASTLGIDGPRRRVRPPVHGARPSAPARRRSARPHLLGERASASRARAGLCPRRAPASGARARGDRSSPSRVARSSKRAPRAGLVVAPRGRLDRSSERSSGDSRRQRRCARNDGGHSAVSTSTAPARPRIAARDQERARRSARATGRSRDRVAAQCPRSRRLRRALREPRGEAEAAPTARATP